MTTRAPQLGSNSYAEFYKIRRKASSMTSNTIKWFRSHTEHLLEESLDIGQPLSILSVGCGDGDIDIEFIKAILPNLTSQKLQYDALEPNLMHRQKFLDSLNRMSLNDRANISVHADGFDEFNTNRKYNLVLLCHVLYYFDEPYQAILRALTLTKPGGRVIIIHQSPVGIPEIQRRHMYELKQNENEIFTAEDVQKLLNEGEHSYRVHNIDAHLEVTECLKQSDIGLKIMSFCMECDLRQIDGVRLNRLTESFSELAESGKHDSAFIYEPLGVFLIEAAEKRKSFEDNDPVEDYRNLAHEFGWSESLLKQEKSDIRLLDVACGTGRWFQAFQWYVKPQVLDVKITYDLLDPSKHSMLHFANKAHPPLKLGRQYTSTLQEASLPENCYDIIWSMHGFYAIPRRDLYSTLKKLHDCLNDGGEIFIAHPTSNSFYVEFHDKLADVFDSGKQSFTASSDITETLSTLGLDYQVQTMSYDECIPLDDLAALEHYILKESVDNSFIWENVADQKAKGRKIMLQHVLDDPKLGAYLSSLVKNNMYCFPQEIWLISFRKKRNSCLINFCADSDWVVESTHQGGNEPLSGAL